MDIIINTFLSVLKILFENLLFDVLACLLLTAELMLLVLSTLCRDSPIDLEEASEVPENLNDDLVNSSPDDQKYYHHHAYTNTFL